MSPILTNAASRFPCGFNGSNVPPDFESDDPAIDPAIVEQARRLSAEIEETPQATEHSPAAADEVEAEFRARVKHMATFR